MRNIEIEIVNQTEDISYEKELTDDILTILTVFSARMNGKKLHKNKLLIEKIKKEISNED